MRVQALTCARSPAGTRRNRSRAAWPSGRTCASTAMTQTRFFVRGGSRRSWHRRGHCAGSAVAPVTPPESVREALRAIYLWWAVEANPAPKPHEPDLHPDFLTESPINWERKEIRTLEELMLTAYPTNTDTVMLASQAGLDPGLISRASSGRRFTREILATASRSGRLEELVETVLSDPVAVSVHEPLRALVGDAWLAAHNL